MLLQHALEHVERPGGSHEGVGRKKMQAGRPALIQKDGTAWWFVLVFAFCVCWFLFLVFCCFVSWCFVFCFLMNVTVHRTMYRSSTSLLLRPLQHRPLRDLINQLISNATCFETC